MADALPAQSFQSRLKRAVDAYPAKNNGVVAKKCGMPLTTLESYLYGRAFPKSNRLAALAITLDVSVDWLLFGARFEGRVFDE